LLRPAAAGIRALCAVLRHDAGHSSIKISACRSTLVGSGRGIHWPDLDEDIAVEVLLAGRRSNEAASSLEKWLSARHRRV
jgi:hypothetical protein